MVVSLTHRLEKQPQDQRTVPIWDPPYSWQKETSKRTNRTTWWVWKLLLWWTIQHFYSLSVAKASYVVKLSSPLEPWGIFMVINNSCFFLDSLLSAARSLYSITVWSYHYHSWNPVMAPSSVLAVDLSSRDLGQGDEGHPKPLPLSCYGICPRGDRQKSIRFHPQS